MNFNRHSNLEGKHAFLGASKYHWINYDKDKLISAFNGALAVKEGTELHELAEMLIKKRVKLPKSQKTLNMYVNDAIGFRMTTEQPLYYSDNCFGTADAISFHNNFLRIHDFKSGATPAHMEQLYIYAALFCLEYDYDPHEISIETRIYQSNNVVIDQPDPSVIIDIMKKIVEFSELIDNLNYGSVDE